MYRNMRTVLSGSTLTSSKTIGYMFDPPFKQKRCLNFTDLISIRVVQSARERHGCPTYSPSARVDTPREAGPMCPGTTVLTCLTPGYDFRPVPEEGVCVGPRNRREGNLGEVHTLDDGPPKWTPSSLILTEEP